MSRFDISELSLPGLKLIQGKPLADARGFLARLFCAKELGPAGWASAIAQINHTHTARRGTVRGMHYQKPPHAEMKLVSRLQGKICDVVVDLRKDSPTFLQWHAELLSADNHSALLIPEGFAHGFQTLSDDVHLLYCHSEAYHPESEEGLNALDTRLGIDWPIEIVERSPRDKVHACLDQAFEGLQI